MLWRQKRDQTYFTPLGEERLWWLNQKCFIVFQKLSFLDFLYVKFCLLVSFLFPKISSIYAFYFSVLVFVWYTHTFIHQNRVSSKRFECFPIYLRQKSVFQNDLNKWNISWSILHWSEVVRSCKIYPLVGRTGRQIRSSRWKLRAP